MTTTTGRPVLVSGAGGFIGCRLVERLLGAGCPVQAIHHSRESADRASARFRSPLLTTLVADLESGAVADAPRSAPLRGAVHLAARVPTSRDAGTAGDRERFRRGVEAPTRAFLGLVADRAPVLVHASSTTVYGERHRGPIDETVAPRPGSDYGTAKLHCEALFEEHARRSGCAAANLRVTQVWGPGEPHGLFAQRVFIPAARSGGRVKLVRGGRDVVDLLWWDDAAAALQAALDRGASGVFNISGGKGMTVLAIAQAIASHTGRSGAVGGDFIEVEDDGSEASVRLYDPGRARRELGYAPRVSMPEALRRLCQ